MSTFTVEPILLSGSTEFEKYNTTYAWDLEDFPSFFPVPNDTINPNRFSTVSSPQFVIGKGTLAESQWQINATLTLINGRRCFGLQLELRSEVVPGWKVVTCNVKIVGSDDQDLEEGYFNDLYDSRHGVVWHGWPNFKDLDMLLNEEEVYFNDHILRIVFDITLHCGIMSGKEVHPVPDTMETHIQKEIEENCQRQKDVMLNLFNSGLMSDAMIVCGEMTFPVHVNILAVQSQVFQRTFETQMKEGISRILDMSNFEAEPVRIFLEFLYTADTPTLLNNLLKPDDPDLITVRQVILLADMYLLPHLTETCLMFLVFNINPDRAAGTALLVYYHSNEQVIKREVGSYCKKNWSILCRNPDFLKYFIEKPSVFNELCDSSLAENDEPVFEIKPPMIFAMAQFQVPQYTSEPQGQRLDRESLFGSKVTITTLAKVAVGAYFVGLALLGWKAYRS